TNSRQISYYCEYVRECFSIFSLDDLNPRNRESVVRNAPQGPTRLLEQIVMARGFLPAGFWGPTKMAELKPDEKITRDAQKGVRRGYV
ncbi:hypothetical protein, partial [Roseicyclus sp.]|uniref:hypothetical protein n=1 Tax=Roseicyclus sp. TaxID=1914329 RepID=UPI003F6A7D8F